MNITKSDNANNSKNIKFIIILDKSGSMEGNYHLIFELVFHPL